MLHRIEMIQGLGDVTIVILGNIVPKKLFLKEAILPYITAWRFHQ
jgi:hypothetical protein